MYKQQAEELGYASFEEALADGWSSAEIASTQIENGSEGYWYIDFDGDVLGWAAEDDEETDKKRKEIGNYFETEEEAEKAVEKLKAWKRLKDKGFRFDGYKTDNGKIKFFADLENWDPVELGILINLLFGGEE